MYHLTHCEPWAVWHRAMHVARPLTRHGSLNQQAVGTRQKHSTGFWPDDVVLYFRHVDGMMGGHPVSY
jgi:hypothetical protein